MESTLESLVDADHGQKAILHRHDKLMSDVKIPLVFKTFGRKRILNKLGIYPLVLDDIYFCQITFNYTSSGGNSNISYSVKLDIDNLSRFIYYVADKVKFRKSIAGQRALMTNELRRKIKERDNYTCKKCGNFTHKEAILLLEIDHIKPLAKGGITSEENLQVLC